MKSRNYGPLVALTCLVVVVAVGLMAQAVSANKRLSTQSKYLSTNSTSTAFTYTAGGRTTLNGVTTIVMPQGARGVRLVPFGAGSDNTTFDYRVWLVRRATGTTGSVAEIEYLGGGTCTLSTAVGQTGDLVSSSERLADTMTWTVSTTATTPKGPGSSIESSNMLGTSYVYSPADNTPAHLSIPDCNGALEILIDIDLTGATSANFLVETGP